MYLQLHRCDNCWYESKEPVEVSAWGHLKDHLGYEMEICTDCLNQLYTRKDKFKGTR